MANTIRLKRASGSDPSASDLVTGELAVRTDTAKLFTKKDDNSVAEIGAALSDGDKGDITVSSSGATFTIDNDAVTYAKIQNITGERLLGRDNSGTGIIEELSASAVRTLLGLATSATTDTTNASNISSGTLAAARVATLNQDTSGTAAIATTVTVADESSDTSCNVLFATAATGNLAPKSGTNLTFNSSSGVLTATGFAGALTGNVTGNASGSSGSCTGNAATATALATARTIAGVSFDGTANISLNNNAITNGAGYITATLTNEQVQDIVGGMLTGNTETGITVTYQDGDGTIDFVVGTLNQDTTGNAATATALETARNIGGVSFDGTGNINLPGVNTSGNQNTSGNAATATKLATARTIAGVSFDGSANISLNNNAITNGAGYLTSVGTSNISDDAVTYAKIQNVSATNRILGRDSSGAGVIEEITPANLRTMLNVADGATNVTNNNQLTNGAGYITSADGGNAATLDSIDSSQFARSDTADTLSGLMTFSGGISLGADARCAAGVSSLSDGSTITVDFTSGIHHSVTLGGNRTFGNPSNDSNAVGQSGSIFITQDGTGSRTASFHSDYKFVGGTAPTLSTAANAVDRLDYVIKASGVIHCVVSLDVK